MCIDDAIPRWDRRERRGIPCDAPPATMSVAEEVKWREIPVFGSATRHEQRPG